MTAEIIPGEVEHEPIKDWEILDLYKVQAAQDKADKTNPLPPVVAWVFWYCAHGADLGAKEWRALWYAVRACGVDGFDPERVLPQEWNRIARMVWVDEHFALNQAEALGLN